MTRLRGPDYPQQKENVGQRSCLYTTEDEFHSTLECPSCKERREHISKAVTGEDQMSQHLWNFDIRKYSRK